MDEWEKPPKTVRKRRWHRKIRKDVPFVPKDYLTTSSSDDEEERQAETDRPKAKEKVACHSHNRVRAHPHAVAREHTGIGPMKTTQGSSESQAQELVLPSLGSGMDASEEASEASLPPSESGMDASEEASEASLPPLGIDFPAAESESEFDAQEEVEQVPNYTDESMEESVDEIGFEDDPAAGFG